METTMTLTPNEMGKWTDAKGNNYSYVRASMMYRRNNDGTLYATQYVSSMPGQVGETKAVVSATPATANEITRAIAAMGAA